MKYAIRNRYIVEIISVCLINDRRRIVIVMTENGVPTNYCYLISIVCIVNIRSNPVYSFQIKNTILERFLSVEMVNPHFYKFMYNCQIIDQRSLVLVAAR